MFTREINLQGMSQKEKELSQIEEKREKNGTARGNIRELDNGSTTYD